ncbi:hypothetical protein Tco_1155300 [Tanacetum coccineum]
MACSLPHTDSEVKALVQKLINEDKGRQNALLELAFLFECAVRDDLRKAYEKCNDISQESRALICTLLKESSNKDRKMHLSMYGKAVQLERQMGAKSDWFREKYSIRTCKGIGCSSSQDNCSLTEKELHQLRMDEEVLKEMLEEMAMNKKESSGKEVNTSKAFMTDKGNYDNYWVVDSGSTEHITHDASILENKSKSHFETPVVIPNGDAISVEGKGEEMDHFDAHENPAQYEALNSSGSHESDQQYYDANLGQESAPEGSNHDASSPISNEVDNMNHMAQEEPLDSSDQLGRPKRHWSQPKHLDDFVAFLAAIDSVDEPKKFHQAVKDERWKEAIRKEIRALEENDTWTL